MRFLCDNCRAQYMISDDKVGPKGVKVRCKKCSYVILVQKTLEPNPEVEAFDPEATQIMENPFIESGPAPEALEGPTNPGPAAVQSEKSNSFLASVPDDEIGAVFDKVLSSGAHTMSDEGTSDLDGKDESTSVLDPDVARRLAQQSVAAPDANGDSENAALAEAAKYDWFVAIDEKQTGPLSLDKVKRHWDNGEIGPDSLCWRAGFADWVPLSDVVELKSVLAPKPAKAVIVAPTPIATPAMVAAPVGSAFAAGAVGDGSAASVGPSADGEWRPVAASALASLVKQEMDVLSKPDGVAPSNGSSARANARHGSLELPAVDQALRSSGQNPSVPSTAGSNGAAYSPQSPVFAPYGALGQPTSKHWRYLAGGAVLMLLLMGLAVGSYLMGENRIGTQRLSPPPVTATTGARDLPMPPPPQPKPAADTKTEPAKTAVKEPASAKDTPEAQNTTPSKVEATPEKAAPHRSERAMRDSSVTQSHRKERSNRSKNVAGTQPETGNSGQGGEVILPASNAEKQADDAFEREFGGPRKEVVPKKEKKESSKTVYVPPAPGSGAELPAQLEISDILQVLLANKPKLTSCRDEQKKKDPNVGGTLVMGWTILTSGRTANISVKSDEFKTSYFANCVAGAIKGWTFPSHRKQGGQVVEGMPFKF